MLCRCHRQAVEIGVGVGVGGSVGRGMRVV